MRRVMGLALVLVVGAGAPTAATNASHAGDRIAGATHQSATTAAARRAVRERTVPVQSTGAAAPTQLSWGGLRREEVNALAAPAALPPATGERSGSVVLPWVSPGESDLAFPVTEQFHIAFGYRHVEGADLWGESTTNGPVDYDSHNVLLGARWRF